MQMSKCFLPLLALAAACADQPTQPVQDAPARGVQSAGKVEHWSVQKDGYGVSLYPGFASRAVLHTAAGEVELYKQDASYRLPAGASGAARQHQIALKGGQYARDLGISVLDPKHEIARIRVYLYGDDHVPGSGIQSEPVETLVVDNRAATCPPACDDVTGSGAASTVSAEQLDAAASFVAPSFTPRVSRAGGYELSVDPSFASRAVATTSKGVVELYRQSAVFNLPTGFTTPAAEHQIRLTGGAGGRNIALQVRDPKHHLMRVIVELYRPGRAPGDNRIDETISISNTAQCCPPHCEVDPGP